MTDQTTTRALEIVEGFTYTSFRPLDGDMMTGCVADVISDGTPLRLTTFHTPNLDDYTIDVWEDGVYLRPVTGEYADQSAVKDHDVPSWVADDDVRAEVMTILDRIASEMRGRVRMWIDDTILEVTSDVLNQWTAWGEATPHEDACRLGCVCAPGSDD